MQAAFAEPGTISSAGRPGPCGRATASLGSRWAVPSVQPRVRSPAVRPCGDRHSPCIWVGLERAGRPGRVWGEQSLRRVAVRRDQEREVMPGISTRSGGSERLVGGRRGPSRGDGAGGGGSEAGPARVAWGCIPLAVYPGLREGRHGLFWVTQVLPASQEQTWPFEDLSLGSGVDMQRDKRTGRVHPQGSSAPALRLQGEAGGSHRLWLLYVQTLPRG